MNNDQMINMLMVVLGIMVSVLIILCIVFVVLRFKNREPKEKKKGNSKVQGGNGEESNVKQQSYSKHSIFDFMEFDKISDNMIIQKDGKRFLMVIECQGVNFDLMSGLEKNSVEAGFLQFLNTLRYPIQLYIQTRTVNLAESIHTYKDRVEEISKAYTNKQMEYNQKVRSGRFTEQQLQKDKYELIRQRNLYEYGIDIVNNTERMSLNRNILSKHYYVVIPCYPEISANSYYDKDEISNIAFSELYTKAQSIISSLGVCGIKSKILDSTELAELLFVAYNRDESETYNLRKALYTGYEDLYSTAPDVFDKRMRQLDIKIEEEALKKANEMLIGAVEENERQARVRRREAELDDLINEMALSMIEDNKRIIDPDVAEIAINNLKNESEKGGVDNGQKAKRTRNSTTR